MSRGRSASPRNLDSAQGGSDAEMRSVSPPPSGTKAGTNLKVVVITNLTRNVVEAHLRTIFSFYGDIKKVDLPLYGKSGQNRGKAALEYFESTAAEKAASHMNKGQLDGATLSVELSDTVLRDRSRSRSPRLPPPPPPRARNGRAYRRSISRSLSPIPRRRGPPPPPRDRDRDVRDRDQRARDSRYTSRYSPPPRRDAYIPRRRPPPGRDSYRPRSFSRSRSPIRRGPLRYGGPRRSPSYERGGTGYRRRSRSRSPYSLASSRSRSRTRSRTRSYSYSSRSSRSRTRSLRSSRSRSREDIRDSRSRSRSPL